LKDVYTKDIDKAKELLTEAGYPDGISFYGDRALLIISIQYGYGGVSGDPACRCGHGDERLNRWSSLPGWRRYITNKEYEATIIGFVGYLNPGDVLGKYITGFRKNFVNYSNEDFDTLIADAKSDNGRRSQSGKFLKKRRLC